MFGPFQGSFVTPVTVPAVFGAFAGKNCFLFFVVFCVVGSLFPRVLTRVFGWILVHVFSAFASFRNIRNSDVPKLTRCKLRILVFGMFFELRVYICTHTRSCMCKHCCFLIGNMYVVYQPEHLVFLEIERSGFGAMGTVFAVAKWFKPVVGLNMPELGVIEVTWRPEVFLIWF